MGRSRGRPLRALLAAAGAAALVLGAAQPASAAPRVTLAVAAPTSGSTVHDTTELRFTGTNLATVRVYRLAHLVATATVTADGTAATSQVDTTAFRDGPVVLSALAWGRGSLLPRASATLLVRVGNATADQHPAGYKLVYGDEFAGRALDRDKWCTRYMYDGGTESAAEQAKIDPSCLGRDPVTGTTLGTLDTLGGNGTAPGQEAQVYRDVNAGGKRMHTVQDGYLSLHATATRLDQPYLKYESAMIRSKREFLPTVSHPLYLTTRVRLPDVLGSWPAFWLAGGYGDGHVRPPWPPEIDILEAPYNKGGNGADVLWTAVQTYYDHDEFPDGPPQGPVRTTYAHPSFDGNAFHADSSIRVRWIEVAAEWTPTSVCWYLDGLKFACKDYKWVANAGPQDTTPATLLLNLAVGGPWAGADGVDTTKFPMTYDIDHVRVYRK
ncbi:Glycosyl hydrolases family 16 [Asanoa ishikariensis]|uniref:Glycosyl hydrolases family 16 n=1 Tax=Asanoa ishikariensis TaxID=137265 RepID=A0A1H3UHW3_9ACTN|nr:glycoside hydrolase family 16 protein [Asanoa ishikariensis]SDZ61994.1 Glycosyl hydrolases family 16 [Asanoa ishikariensis]